MEIPKRNQLVGPFIGSLAEARAVEARLTFGRRDGWVKAELLVPPRQRPKRPNDIGKPIPE